MTRPSPLNVSIWIGVVAILAVAALCLRQFILRDKYRLVSKQTINLGQFEASSETLIVSDPGYEIDTVQRGNGVVLKSCANGRWNCSTIVKSFALGHVIVPHTSELRATHESVTDFAGLTWIKDPIPIGVDSGQAGIFDRAHFRDDSIVSRDFEWKAFAGKPASPDEPWYSFCAELTTAKPEGSVLTGGVVSQAGKGDGAYDCFVAKNRNGKVVGVWVLFVNDQGEG